MPKCYKLRQKLKNESEKTQYIVSVENEILRILPGSLHNIIIKIQSKVVETPTMG